MDLKTYANWNQQGLFPGPEETEESFATRARFCLTLEQQLKEKVDAELPFKIEDQATQDILQDAYTKTQKLYGITPRWTPVFFNNYQLTPWHGGCAWIFQLNEETPTAAFLQLRAQFRKQSTYLGIYNRSELIAHEFAHVGRMMYQEPQFEEILAYRSSHSSWRRWFGPIIQSAKESLFFILFLALLIMIDLALINIQQPVAYVWAFWIKWIFAGIILFALGRLTWRHWQFNRCLKHLEKLYQNKQTAEHLIYRLRDNEIKLFASSSSATICKFIQDQSILSFRWRFLMQQYPLFWN